MAKYTLFGGCREWKYNEIICIYELPRLDFLQFQHHFRSYSDKKGLLLGAITLQCVCAYVEGGKGLGGGG